MSHDENPRARPDLATLYAPPSEMIQKAVLGHLADVHLQYLRAATFFCLATAGAGGLDASPRGGPAGFVRALDSRTVVFADWPGNNRIESMRNLSGDSRMAMLFLFPGLEVFMRINGSARLADDPALLESLAEAGRVPKLATVVAVEEVLMHCGRAANRARLWDETSRLPRGTLPTVGQIMASLSLLGAEMIAATDERYDHAVRTELY